MRAAGSDPSSRRRGRIAALQLLYQREVGGFEGAPFDDAVSRYWREHFALEDGPAVEAEARPPAARARAAALPRADAARRRARPGGAEPAPAVPRRFADQLLRGTLEAIERIDPLIESAADHWRLDRMAVIDRLVLRLGVYELLAAETPAAVVIDEAIELARAFGDDPSPRFVNGVLDAVRRRLEEDRQKRGPLAP